MENVEVVDTKETKLMVTLPIHGANGPTPSLTSNLEPTNQGTPSLAASTITPTNTHGETPGYFTGNLVQAIPNQTFSGDNTPASCVEAKEFAQNFLIFMKTAHWSPEIARLRLSQGLLGTARLWYNSEDRSSQSLEAILEQLTEDFKPTYGALGLRTILQTRVQQQFESVTSYSITIKDLIHRVDPMNQMPEDQKVFHFMNGLKQPLQTSIINMCLVSGIMPTPGDLSKLTLPDVIRRAQALEYMPQMSSGLPESARGPGAFQYQNTTSQSGSHFTSAQPPRAVQEVTVDYLVQLREQVEHLESRFSVSEVSGSRSDNRGRERRSYADSRRNNRGPSTPCSICDTPDAMHWQRDCPLAKEAKALRMQKLAAESAAQEKTKQSNSNGNTSGKG